MLPWKRVLQVLVSLFLLAGLLASTPPVDELAEPADSTGGSACRL